ncbi:MAG: M24 family metallopeptidase [Acidimicrobiales bacterium]
MTEPGMSPVADLRRARLTRVRARMEELGVAALLLSHGADLPWLTGYRAMPLERLTMLVLRRTGDPVLVVPLLEVPRVPDPGELFEVEAWGDTDDPIEVVARVLGSSSSSGLEPATGVLGISDRAWATTVLALQRRLPGRTVIEASSVTSPLRAVKDEHEIATLRAAAQAADRVAAALQAGEIGLVGRREVEVSDEISRRLVAEGHRCVNFAIVGSGPNGASPHHDAGDRIIAPGDSVVCDFGGELALPGDGVAYCSDITRTVVAGYVDPQVAECYEVLHAAQAAGVAAARPGVAAEDVDAAARSVIVDAGFGKHFIHRTGHGIGIEEHEDPYVVEGNGTLLEPGHAFSVEPGIYFSGRWGMRLEDIVVVCEDGREALNTVDRGLAVVDA